MIAESTLINDLKDLDTRPKAFELVVRTYKERLYWHIRRMVLDHQDTDDVLQNTFIKAYRHIDGFKGESKLYTWLYRIATNEAISFLKQKSKTMGITDGELQDRMVTNLRADTYFDGNEIQLLLQEALATLPDKQKLVFNMKYFEELKYEEMSEILETSVGALKASYHLAVKKITQYLETH